MIAGQDLAALFKTITHGVYVVGVAHGDQRNAFTAAWVMQVSFSPLLLAVSVNRGHRSYVLLGKGGGFTVNVLGRDQLDVAEHFGRPAVADKLSRYPWTPGYTGAPLLSDALACFDCFRIAEHPAGDHVIVVGRVVDGALRDSGAEPMSYRDTGNMDGAEAIYRGLSLPQS